MFQIIIEKMDNVLFARIKELAQARDVSVEEQILSVLREALQLNRENMAEDREDLLECADRIATMTPKGIRQTDSTLLIREDRDR
ncbi:MAG TPA: hypothetical protein VME69_02735 [Methylocella sp.]|nr:hypothetical protein [Methylocella sp.]